MTTTFAHDDRERRVTGGMPRRRGFDGTFALLADPYRFIARQCVALGSDAFETRLMLQRTICLSGPHAARLFYDRSRFARAGAAPEPLRATLFGKGGVQTLDGAMHRQRKALFVGWTSAERVGQLVGLARAGWETALDDWQRAGDVALYRAVQPVLARAVCDWVGVPVPAEDLQRRTRQLTALFDAAASGPLAHLRSRFARFALERWLARIVREARAGSIALPDDSAARSVLDARDADGRLLRPRVAAVELLNLLRPTVAVSVFIAFVAHALHASPAWAARLADGSRRDDVLAFVQEVRRFYPFFPATVARVRHDFTWEGLTFRRGRRVLLDLYGTDHDARSWPDPDVFRPERWQERTPTAYEFVPQGGGDVEAGHRCPGEDVTVRLMMLAVEMLVRRMRYDVAPQDLRVALHRLPAIPTDGFVIRGVRRA